jgi:hypothetical protein
MKGVPQEQCRMHVTHACYMSCTTSGDCQEHTAHIYSEQAEGTLHSGLVHKGTS